jgi:hypothetical protein
VAELLEEMTMPEFKDQKDSDFSRILAATSKMFVQHLTDCLRIEVPSLESAAFEKQPRKFFLHLLAHPVDQRKGKALLRPVQNLPGNTDLLPQFLKNVFGRALAEFPMGG